MEQTDTNSSPSRRGTDEQKQRRSSKKQLRRLHLEDRLTTMNVSWDRRLYGSFFVILAFGCYAYRKDATVAVHFVFATLVFGRR